MKSAGGLAALVLLALVETLASLWFAHTAPRGDEYAQLRNPVRQLRRAGDALVVAPTWAGPHVRAALGGDLVTAAQVAGPDSAAMGAAIEISVGGARAEEVRDFREVARHDTPAFTVRRLENPKHTPARVDFVDLVGTSDTRVSIERAGARSRPCMFNPQARPVAGGLGGHPTWPARRFVCPGEARVRRRRDGHRG